MLRRGIAVHDIVCARGTFECGCRRRRGIIDVYEAPDSLTFADYRNLPPAHLFTHVALGRVPGPRTIEESIAQGHEFKILRPRYLCFQFGEGAGAGRNG